MHERLGLRSKALMNVTGFENHLSFYAPYSAIIASTASKRIGEDTTATLWDIIAHAH